MTLAAYLEVVLMGDIFLQNFSVIFVQDDNLVANELPMPTFFG